MLELPTRVIRLLTDVDDLVLDCFLGSGTTAVACVREGRQYLGIELDETYVQLAHDHISAELNREQMLMPVSPQEEQYVQLHHQQLIVEDEHDAD
ncbi:site-specific DNA-methyltransferase [Candidatus Chloroploca sp. Khr17]|uniref:site-specific DNA-methyltransferase n=1 Tax=Candidatus Chloroploca sp. Khr17 TaxID=2496869 RepID=UPI001F102733|nr:site-specific DNA-methyltransferase [Candidatus Chloroploca sp. Khr17]